MRKFFLALTLAAVLLSLAPGFASDARAAFLYGSGTEEAPYIITTPEQLAAVSESPSLYYKLSGDIDLTEYLSPDGAGNDEGKGWKPIGTNNEWFTGGLDGGGYEISGLWLARDTNYTGLFGCTYRASIKNLGVRGEINGKDYAGGIVGSNNDSSLEGCRFGGAVSGASYVGGLVGRDTNGVVRNSYAVVDVRGKMAAGGLVGYQMSDKDKFSVIESCYAAGSVTASETHSGGLAGVQQAEINGVSNISNCYAVCDVSAGDVSARKEAGALVGKFLNTNASRVENSFRYERARVNGAAPDAGTPNGVNGSGIAAAGLTAQPTYTDGGWAFDGPWFWDGAGFPKLNIGAEGYPFPFPAVTGPASAELTEGYGAAAFSFSVSGNPAPSVTVDGDHLGKIVWNGTESALEILPGLPEGTYRVTLSAANDVDTASAGFALTVVPAPTTTAETTAPAIPTESAIPATTAEPTTAPLIPTIQTEPAATATTAKTPTQPITTAAIPTNPTETTQPNTTAANPTNPTESTQPGTTAATPTNPTESTQPNTTAASPTNQTESTQPNTTAASPTNPTETTQPNTTAASPTDPTETTQTNTAPTGPFIPTEPPTQPNTTQPEPERVKAADALGGKAPAGAKFSDGGDSLVFGALEGFGVEHVILSNEALGEGWTIKEFTRGAGTGWTAELTGGGTAITVKFSAEAEGYVTVTIASESGDERSFAVEFAGVKNGGGGGSGTGGCRADGYLVFVLLGILPFAVRRNF